MHYTKTQKNKHGEVTKHDYKEGQHITSKLLGSYNNNTYS